jgi:hypothetical protein
MRYYLEYELDDIKKLEKDDQIQIMKNWFLSNYQNPEGEIPYDKEEGDYVYIYGGPYDAREELNDQFADYVDESIIEELVEELENDCYEWSGIDFDFNTEFAEISEVDPFENLKHSIEILRKLQKENYEKNVKEIFLNMIAVNCITILEAFLSEYLITKVLNDNLLLKNLVENISDFGDMKISLNEIYSKYDNIKEIAKNYLSNLIYHNLSKISKIYEQVFGKQFPKNIGFIYKMIEIRHDIVHRNGKKKNGSKILITEMEVEQLFYEITKLAEYIDKNMKEEYKF